MFSAGVGVGVVFLKLLESESGVGVGFSKMLESESGVGVGFLKLLESESGVGVGFSKQLESESGVGVGILKIFRLHNPDGHIPNVKRSPKTNTKSLRKNTPRLAGSAKNAKR